MAFVSIIYFFCGCLLFAASIKYGKHTKLLIKNFDAKKITIEDLKNELRADLSYIKVILVTIPSVAIPLLIRGMDLIKIDHLIGIAFIVAGVEGLFYLLKGKIEEKKVKPLRLVVAVILGLTYGMFVNV